MKAKYLEFISRIKADGSGTEPVSKSFKEHLKTNSIMANENYSLQCLSITNGTWIASCMSSFIVKKKPNAPETEFEEWLNDHSHIIKHEEVQHFVVNVDDLLEYMKKQQL